MKKSLLKLVMSEFSRINTAFLCIFLFFINYLSFAQSPVIVKQPQSQTAIYTETASFDVAATGASPLSYQWYFNSVPISGLTSSTLSILGVSFTMATNITVVVSNAYGTVTSETARITVHCSLKTYTQQDGKPTIGAGTVARDPDLPSYARGSKVRLTAVPAPSSAFVIWYDPDNVVFRGGSTTTLDMFTNYRWIASFTQPAAVNDIILNHGVTELTGAWQTASNAPGKLGPSYLFLSTSDTQTGTAIYRPNVLVAGKYDVYIWYPQGGNRATNAPWITVSQDGSETNYVDQMYNGGYWYRISKAKQFTVGTNGYIQISNECGGSGRVVIANGVKFVYAFTPAIYEQPTNQMSLIGQSARFSVAAYGSRELHYQWKKDGANISGANAPTFSLSRVQSSDAADYSVQITNTVGIITSENVRLDVPVLTFLPPELRFTGWNKPHDFVFEATSDFLQWIELTNIILKSDFFEVADPLTNSSRRFYRMRTR
jgi:hypothetical protein